MTSVSVSLEVETEAESIRLCDICALMRNERPVQVVGA